MCTRSGEDLQVNETLERDHVYPTLMQKGERASSSVPDPPPRTSCWGACCLARSG